MKRNQEEEATELEDLSSKWPKVELINRDNDDETEEVIRALEHEDDDEGERAYFPIDFRRNCPQSIDRYGMQDLHVSETLPQMVALSEAYTQICEQQ